MKKEKTYTGYAAVSKSTNTSTIVDKICRYCQRWCSLTSTLGNCQEKKSNLVVKMTYDYETCKEWIEKKN